MATASVAAKIRNGEIAKIKVGAKALGLGYEKDGLDEGAYRAMLSSQGGKPSCADLDKKGRMAVIDYLDRQGAYVGRASARQSGQRRDKSRPTNEWAFVFRLPADRQPLGKKIYALCKAIAELDPEAVKAKLSIMPVRYVEGIAKQMAGLSSPVVHPLPMCDAGELWRIVAALEKHKRRLMEKAA